MIIPIDSWTSLPLVYLLSHAWSGLLLIAFLLLGHIGQSLEGVTRLFRENLLLREFPQHLESYLVQSKIAVPKRETDTNNEEIFC